MPAHRRLARLLVLSVLAAAAATGFSLSSADASGTTATRAPAGGFAGAVNGPPRPIDRDLEGGAASLHAVACAAPATAARCWVG